MPKPRYAQASLEARPYCYCCAPSLSVWSERSYRNQLWTQETMLRR